MRSAALIAAIVAVCATPPAHADGPDPAVKPPNPVEELEQRWRDLEYEAVIAAADEILGSNADGKTKVEALRLKGSALVVLGRTDEAEATFIRIFAIDPNFELPDDTSPRVLAVFRPVRATWQVAEEKRLATELGPALAQLHLAVKLPAKAKGGRPLAVTVELTDPSAIASSLLLFYRRAQDQPYSTLTAVARDGTTSLTIPETFTASPKQYTLELYVRVRHRSGLTLRQEGTPERPVTLAVGAGQVPRPTPIYKKWWLYGILTAGVGLVVTVLVLAVDAGPQDIVVTEAP